MKIGILGGSFDPIHNGHLNMALKSYEQYNLDEVWLIPNGNAPHKDAPLRESGLMGAVCIQIVE